jgi:hypothetical protein
MSRQGKHRIGKVSIGLYVDEDFRALLALVVDQSGETATDIMMEGVRQKATNLGILKNGEVAEEYKEAIEIIKAVYAEKKGVRNAK